MAGVLRFVREHSLSIVTLTAFVAIWLGGQAWSGHRTYNAEQSAHGESDVSTIGYLFRSQPVHEPHHATGAP